MIVVTTAALMTLLLLAFGRRTRMSHGTVPVETQRVRGTRRVTRA